MCEEFEEFEGFAALDIDRRTGVITNVEGGGSGEVSQASQKRSI